MKTNSKSPLNPLTAGCVLAVLLFHSAGSVRGETEETIDKTTSASSGGAPATATATQQNNITGTWNFSIRYTGGDDRSTYALKRVSGPAKGKDVSFSVAAANNVGEQITARFTGEVLSSGKMEGTVTLDLKSFSTLQKEGQVQPKSIENLGNETDADQGPDSTHIGNLLARRSVRAFQFYLDRYEYE